MVPAKAPRGMVYSVNYGVEVSAGDVGISFMHNSAIKMPKNIYSH